MGGMRSGVWVVGGRGYLHAGWRFLLAGLGTRLREKEKTFDDIMDLGGALLHTWTLVRPD